MLRKTFCALLLLPALCLAGDPLSVPLWPDGAPGSEGKTEKEVMIPRAGDEHTLVKIHNPSLTVYLPSKEKNTGAAIIVAPGGGHRHLAIDHEGFDVAQWLADHGIAGLVLKYRLAREEGSTYTVEEHAGADGLRAIRLVRSRAKEWGIDPERVGIMGFSAGGQVAMIAGARGGAGAEGAADAVERESARPAFMALVYSGGTRNATFSKDTPPTFLLVAQDDGASAGTASAYLALKEAGVPVELHIYGAGGHGFGMRNRPLPVSKWPNVFRDWLDSQGFLKKH